MKNKRSCALRVIGIVVVVATLLLFLITRKGDIKGSEFLGLCFMIYAELIVVGGLLAIEHLADGSSQPMLRGGCGSTLILYGVLTFILAFIAVLLKTDSVTVFWMIEILAFAVAAVLMILFFTASKSIKKSDDRILDAAGEVAGMIDRLTALQSQGKWNRLLDRPIEDLKYSDRSSGAEADKELKVKITMLELEAAKPDAKSDGEEIQELIKDIAVLIKKRKVQVRNKKMGGL